MTLSAIAAAVLLGASMMVVGTNLEPDSNLSADIEDSSYAPPPRVLGAVEHPEIPLEPVAPAPAIAVVRVSVTRCGERTVGTGVVVANNTVITAAHVVGDAGIVRIDYGAITVSGVVEGVLGDGRDLAVVEIDAPLVEDFPATTVEPGEAVHIMGFPDGGALVTVTGPTVMVEPAVANVVAGPVLGVKADTGPGFSGGPALNEEGRLVGLAVAVELRSQTALVSPIADVGELLEAPLVDGKCPHRA